MSASDVKAVRLGNLDSDQAEASTLNPIANRTEMRILIELQVISYLLHHGMGGAVEDLRTIRRAIAGTIT